MQLAISEAKPRLSELIAAAERGERVVITRRGEPAVELVACPKRKRRGGINFKRLAETKRRLGIVDDPPEVAREVIAALENPALSRQVLGLEDDLVQPKSSAFDS